MERICIRKFKVCKLTRFNLGPPLTLQSVGLFQARNLTRISRAFLFQKLFTTEKKLLPNSAACMHYTIASKVSYVRYLPPILFLQKMLSLHHQPTFRPQLNKNCTIYLHIVPSRYAALKVHSPRNFGCIFQSWAKWYLLLFSQQNQGLVPEEFQLLTSH